VAYKEENREESRKKESECSDMEEEEAY